MSNKNTPNFSKERLDSEGLLQEGEGLLQWGGAYYNWRRGLLQWEQWGEGAILLGEGVIVLGKGSNHEIKPLKGQEKRPFFFREEQRTRKGQEAGRWDKGLKDGGHMMRPHTRDCLTLGSGGVICCIRLGSAWVQAPWGRREA